MIRGGLALVGCCRTVISAMVLYCTCCKWTRYRTPDTIRPSTEGDLTSLKCIIPRVLDCDIFLFWNFVGDR